MQREKGGVVVAKIKVTSYTLTLAMAIFVEHRSISSHDMVTKSLPPTGDNAGGGPRGTPTGDCGKVVFRVNRYVWLANRQT